MMTRADAGGLVALVPEGGRFEGLVATRGDSRLEGAVEGEVLVAGRVEVGEKVVAGRVEVGEKAQVRARIEADEIVIEGAVEGDVTSRRLVELGPAAVLEGNLDTPRLVTADGCRFDGRLTMTASGARKDPSDSP
jgi:cytoskeletal protein CcmA (bactofilin family)